MSVDDWLLHGFYPRIYDQKLDPNKAYRNYFETYIERDLRQLIQIKDLHLFQKFIRLCAGRTGQLLNVSSLSNDVGVSVFAVSAWLAILQASYVVFLLEPYFENVGKRLIKAPKLYFYDVGLATYLLGVGDKRQLERHPLRGNLFENLVVQELVKNRYNRGLDHPCGNKGRPDLCSGFPQGPALPA
jgi:predicted AAA+ superfamily ATPase